MRILIRVILILLFTQFYIDGNCEHIPGIDELRRNPISGEMVYEGGVVVAFDDSFPKNLDFNVPTKEELDLYQTPEIQVQQVASIPDMQYYNPEKQDTPEQQEDQNSN